MCRNNTVNRDNRKNCANILRKEVDIMSDVKMELYHGSGDIVEFQYFHLTLVKGDEVVESAKIGSDFLLF